MHLRGRGRHTPLGRGGEREDEGAAASFTRGEGGFNPVPFLLPQVSAERGGGSPARYVPSACLQRWPEIEDQALKGGAAFTLFLRLPNASLVSPALWMGPYWVGKEGSSPLFGGQSFSA